MFVELGGAFTDPGATANDTCAGVVPVIVSGRVNTDAVGTNTLTYTATDGNGNTNSATRTVIVRDTTPPAISWSFTNLVLAADTNCGALMPDVTGTNYILATDLSGALTISQDPTNNFILPLGTNVVVIAVADASGNTAFLDEHHCCSGPDAAVDFEPAAKPDQSRRHHRQFQRRRDRLHAAGISMVFQQLRSDR